MAVNANELPVATVPVEGVMAIDRRLGGGGFAHVTIVVPEIPENVAVIVALPA